ncbi:MAG: response regulator [Candidatus Eisenbacteria bacterium]|nr:response regulator [Candidatus Eisenbacteria bacterium]MCC7141646.1 response regulator [Candidatus Eisenbacteria bacterium]
MISRGILPRSLRGRFLLAYGISLSVSCVCLALLLWSQVRATIHHEFQKRGEALTQILMADARHQLTDSNPAQLQAHVDALLRNEDVEYVIIQGADGQVLAQASRRPCELRWIRSHLVALAWRSAEPAKYDLKTQDGRVLLNFHAPIDGSTGVAPTFRHLRDPLGGPQRAEAAVSLTGNLAAVRLGVSATRTLGQVNRALWISLACGLSLALLGFVGIVATARWTLRPLHRMSEVARAIAQGDLSQRVPVEADDEVGTLARAFGEMSQSLEQSRDAIARQHGELEQAALENERLLREAERSLSELREAQTRLAYSEETRRMDRLRTVGQMASGIAHNFNNVMSAIIGRVQLLKLKSDAGRLGPDEIKSSLDVIEQAGLDGAETVRRLQEFSRGDTSQQPLPTELNEVVRSIVEITRPRWKDQAEQGGVHIRLHLDLNQIPTIACVASEIREVLTNLIFNAVDAMPKGGDLVIRTRGDEEWIHLDVTDTGTGMSSQTRERLFDPFYTTKGVKGTGLGLSTVYGIVKRHGGEINVESEEGVGTTFTVSLPLSLKGAAHRTEEGMMSSRPWRILVGDDESNVREVLVELLRFLGHEVREATGGRETIEIFSVDQFDLVFTDLGMPDLSGWEVAEEIRRRDPEVAIVLATGWGTQINQADAQARGITRVLAKPFTVQKVSSLIAELQGMQRAA